MRKNFDYKCDVELMNDATVVILQIIFSTNSPSSQNDTIHMFRY